MITLKMWEIFNLLVEVNVVRIKINNSSISCSIFSCVTELIDPEMI